MTLYDVVIERLYVLGSLASARPVIVVNYTRNDENIQYLYISFTDEIDTTTYVWFSEEYVGDLPTGSPWEIHMVMNENDISPVAAVTATYDRVESDESKTVLLYDGELMIVYVEGTTNYRARTTINGRTYIAADVGGYLKLAVAKYAYGEDEYVTVDQSGADPADIFVFQPPSGTLTLNTIEWSERGSGHTPVYDGTITNKYMLKPVNIEYHSP